MHNSRIDQNVEKHVVQALKSVTVSLKTKKILIELLLKVIKICQRQNFDLKTELSVVDVRKLKSFTTLRNWKILKKIESYYNLNLFGF